MHLYDLHVCVKGMAHPDNCRNYFWLKGNEVNDMVSISREAFDKAHNPLTGGKHSDGDISYEWKARDTESGSPMEKWAKGSFDSTPGSHQLYTCASCGLEGKSRSKALGHCESCGVSIPRLAGFKAAAELPTADTADSAPGKVEQAGHEGCDPSKPHEREFTGEHADNPEEFHKKVDEGHAQRCERCKSGTPCPLGLALKKKVETGDGPLSKSDMTEKSLSGESPKDCASKCGSASTHDDDGRPCCGGEMCCPDANK